MSDSKVADIPYSGSPVARISLRDRKKGKFKRHLAGLSSPTNKDKKSSPTVKVESSSPIGSSKKVSDSPGKGTQSKIEASTVRSQPAQRRSRRSTTLTIDYDKNNSGNATTTFTSSLIASVPDDIDSVSERFPNRQIKYIATSPSEDSDTQFSFPIRPTRSLMTNPSDDSMESFVTTNSHRKKENASKLPTFNCPSCKALIGNPVDGLEGSATSAKQGLNQQSSAKESEKVSTNTKSYQDELPREDSIGRAAPARRWLHRRHSSHSHCPVEKIDYRIDAGIPFDNTRISTTVDVQSNLGWASKQRGERSKGTKENNNEKSSTAFETSRIMSRSSSLTRLSAISSTKSLMYLEAKHGKNPKEGGKTSSKTSLSASIAPRSRSFDKLNLSQSRPSTPQKGLSERGRSFSCGRRSRLVDKMVNKQGTLLQGRRKESPLSSQPAEPAILTHETTSEHNNNVQIQGSRDLAIGRINDVDIDATRADPSIECWSNDDKVKTLKRGNLETQMPNHFSFLENSPNLQVELISEFLEMRNQDFDRYGDPPLAELESEVSTGFDMGSIHDHLTTDACHSSSEVMNDHSKWESSVFETVGDEKKEDASGGFPAEDFALDSNKFHIVEEKREIEAGDLVRQPLCDASWDISLQPFAGTDPGMQHLRTITDGIDSFETSSWAVETDARFSDVSLPKLAVDTGAEKQFVHFMREEMKFRALSDRERVMLIEAQKNLMVTEETAMNESMEPEQDREPLIHSKDTSAEDSVAVEENAPLEARLKIYEGCAENDQDSTYEDSDAEKPSTDMEKTDYDSCVDVAYVEQVDDEESVTDEVAECLSGGERNETIVVVIDVPELSFDSRLSSSLPVGEMNQGSMSHATSEHVKVSLDSIPPPPPGMPKKKKKSKSKSSQKIQLIPPPPEEKIKQWTKKKPSTERNVVAMNKKLEKDSALHFFHSVDYQVGFAPHPLDQKLSAEYEEKDREIVVGSILSKDHPESMEEEDLLELNMFLSALSNDDGDDITPYDGFDNVAESFPFNMSPKPGTFSALHDVKGVHPLLSLEEPADKTYSQVERSMDRRQENSQSGLFAVHEKQPGYLETMNLFHDKAGYSKKSDTLLSDEDSAEKIAFSTSAAATTVDGLDVSNGNLHVDRFELLGWFSKFVLGSDDHIDISDDLSSLARGMLLNKRNFNSLCEYLAANVNEVTMLLRPGVGASESVLSSFDESTVVSMENTLDSFDERIENKRPLMKPLILSDSSANISPLVLSANYVSFFAMVAKLSQTSSPFGDNNPFLRKIVASSLKQDLQDEDTKTPIMLLFAEIRGREYTLVEFAYNVKCSCDAEMKALSKDCERIVLPKKGKPNRLFMVPESHPSPFEVCVWEMPRVVAVVLSFLGDPVAVCRVKMINRFCHRLVLENEHVLMQNAVRSGGLDMTVRPAFWMYVTLQKCKDTNHDALSRHDDFIEKARIGRQGKWHSVIERDVARSFGNMPPHKQGGAKLKGNSIVRALVTYGQNRIMSRGVRGGGEPFPTPEIGPKNMCKQKARATPLNVSSPPWKTKGDIGEDDQADSVASDTVTVSDWGGVSPKGSFAGSLNDSEYDNQVEGLHMNSVTDMATEELALSGNSLTQDAKTDLRNKLSFILHSLAVSHEAIGYCQGMDYVVAHLLRILQATVKWQVANNALPDVLASARSINVPVESTVPKNILTVYSEVDKHFVVEEVVLRIMNTLFLHYNLRHFYWPELRCLKVSCRVFERLIQVKLPVLYDHFEHHELNVGLFALGWFQTLFLYLPSMPSATVCHIWDIWLVERSFKIFFRVGTAILFLSQPTLLNQELEGMMIYLNTIPDATLLRPDILIPCALNIKVTNRMLQELEAEVMQQP